MATQGKTYEVRIRIVTFVEDVKTGRMVTSFETVGLSTGGDIVEASAPALADALAATARLTEAANR